MLVCPNCSSEIDLSEIGEVCINCGIQVPFDLDADEDELIAEEIDDSVHIEQF